MVIIEIKGDVIEGKNLLILRIKLLHDILDIFLLKSRKFYFSLNIF